MSVEQNIRQLQQAANYRMMSSNLRGGGIGSIIFGIIGLVIGCGAIEEDPLNGILVAIGIGLVLEGIWVIAMPSPAGFIAEGLAMMTVGTWNIFVTIASMEVGGGGSFFGVLGAYQLYWGLRSFGRYGRFVHVPLQKPSKEVLDRVDEMVGAVLSGKPKDNDHPVEFKEGNKSWKGMLYGDVAVLVKEGGQDILFTDRERALRHWQKLNGKENREILNAIADESKTYGQSALAN